ncbi:hypothetical protein [Paenibacillus dakarensis]|uniref:hypothetical protein n=1 Tax=Paenibacillus dakarensis TaxID=1527293 RepID=UPI0006D5455A|nr:hypothetical protein [Paenibacillus dakarensis]
MNGPNAMKLVLLAAGIAILNIVVLSPGLIGVEIGGDNALQSAFGVTVLFMSLLILLYGSYALLFKRPVLAPVRDLKSREEYIAAVQRYRNVKVLKNEIAQALDQLERIEKKKLTLLVVLRQRFEPAELSYKKFHSVITEVEKLFYLNITGMLNKLGVFSASDFSSLDDQRISTQRSAKVMQQKAALYEEYLAYVAGYLDGNEEILLKLDQLLLEISLLGSIEYKEIDEMPCMKEIDLLINHTKLYKQ